MSLFHHTFISIAVEMSSTAAIMLEVHVLFHQELNLNSEINGKNEDWHTSLPVGSSSTTKIRAHVKTETAIKFLLMCRFIAHFSMLTS